MMNIVTLRLKYIFTFLLFCASPVYALQINISADQTTVKEGGTVVYKAEFIEEHADASGCTVGLELFSSGTSVLDKDYSISKGEFGNNITVNEDDFTMVFTATGTEGASHSLIVSLLIKDNDGIEQDETIAGLVREGVQGGQEEQAAMRHRCSISNTYVFPTVTIVDTDKVAIGKRSTSTANLKNTTCVSLRETVATADIQDRDKKDEESLKKLTGDGLLFYKSNCQKNSNTRNFEAEETFSQGTVIVSSADKQMGNIHTRLDKLRASGGRRGADISNASLNIQGTSISVGMFGAGAGDDNELLANSRWGLFANGEYGFGSKKRKNDLEVGSGDRNFDFHSKGLTLGADYRFPNEKLISGVALGYKDFDADFITQSGNINTKGYNLSLYGTYLVSDKSYVDVVLGVGNDKIISHRPVNNDGSGGIGSKSTFAIGKPKAKEILFSIGAGYEFHKAEWTLTPYGRMDYIQGKLGAYTETASHSSATTSLLQFNKQTTESLASTFGVKATRVISSPKGVFIPHVSLEWKHDFKERGAISGKSSFLESNTQLNLSSNFEETNKSSLDKDYFNIGVGVSAVFPKGRSAYINLESRLGDSTIKDNAIKAGFRWEF